MVRSRWRRIVLVAFLTVMGLGTLTASRPSLAQGSQAMGPRDVAVIPIESVPSWVSEGVARNIPREGDGGIEVLAVLRDPRDVPIDRFLYALTDRGEVMVNPEAESIRKNFEGRGHSAVAVYVRATARADVCEDCYEGDPFFVDSFENMERNPDTADMPWRALGVAYETEGVSVLPCLEPMAIDRRARPFAAPDTGARIRPDEYLPPMPQYVVKDNAFDPDLLQGEMEAGEAREGWVLCLAPDVPADEVRIVAGVRFPSGPGSMGRGRPYWVPVDEMPIGAWHLLEDREVLGWHEDARQMRGDDPIHLDEQVVYEGDVWVSMVQALRYIYTPRVDQDGNLVEPYEEQIRVQLYFDGMEELLETWDQLALSNGLEITAIDDIRAPWGNSLGEVVDLRARGSSFEDRIYSVDGETEPRPELDVVWVYAGDLDQPEGIGPIKVWRTRFEEIGAKDLTPDAICAVIECVTVPVGPMGREVDTPLPIIPVGTQAFGLTVRSARFVQPPILWVGGLDVFIEEGSTSLVTGSWKWLMVEVEAEGVYGALRVLNLPGGALFDEVGYGAEPRMNYGVAGSYIALGGVWRTYARSGGGRLVLVAEVPADWRLENTVLVRRLGPVWALP